MNTLETGLVRLQNGLVLSYAEQGRPRSPPVVLLHGYTDSWTAYHPLMAALPPDLRVIALTLRGHGGSSKPLSGYTIGAFAEDVVTAMDALGIAEAVLVGHSMGSLVAERIAAVYPKRVSQLILIGAFATLKGNSAVEALWRDNVAHLRDPVDPAFAREFQMSSLAGPVAAEFVDGVVAESLRVPAHVWRSILHSLLNENNASQLGHIRAPTLIIWGDRDAFCDRVEQERLAYEIPNARLLVHAGVGHAPHWENPGRVASELTDFIGEAGRDAA